MSHSFEKVFIQNRKGQNMSVILEQAAEQKGLAFVMHGLGGFKEQPHINAFADAFKVHSFSVVRFDTTNTLGSGESDGNYEDATTTNYYEDLEDVIAWASEQEWYQEPFALAGHSLGGISTALYAQTYPKKVSMLAPISSVVSGALSAQTKEHKAIAKEWEETGWRTSESASQPGVVKKLKWSHMIDRLKYDLLPSAAVLTMPVLLIVGSEDKGTPEEHQKMLFNAIPGDKKVLHLIDGAPHTFRDEKHLQEVKAVMTVWVGAHI